MCFVSRVLCSFSLNHRGFLLLREICERFLMRLLTRSVKTSSSSLRKQKSINSVWKSYMEVKKASLRKEAVSPRTLTSFAISSECSWNSPFLRKRREKAQRLSLRYSVKNSMILVFMYSRMHLRIIAFQVSA